jgi:hypothetical protein
MLWVLGAAKLFYKVCVVLTTAPAKHVADKPQILLPAFAMLSVCVCTVCSFFYYLFATPCLPLHCSITLLHNAHVTLQLYLLPRAWSAETTNSQHGRGPQATSMEGHPWGCRTPGATNSLQYSWIAMAGKVIQGTTRIDACPHA